jgi:hypothetical protein
MRGSAMTNVQATIIAGMTGLLLMATPAMAARAVPQPPRPGCVAVSKTEYNSALKSRMRGGRFGEYARTRKLLRRYYWYCPG